MPKLIILGSASAVPDEQHENTHMAVENYGETVLIDCVNSPIVRLGQAGLPLESITDLFLTHFHPDHVSGTPSLLMGMWLLGRTRPLAIHGLEFTLERLEKLMDFYEWRSWPNFYPVSFQRLPEQEGWLALERGGMRVYTSPVQHLLPNIGLRIEFSQTGKSLAYSCDTEPCPQVERLATGVNVLIHESTGAMTGHSSAAQAGEVARKVEAGSLYLIHYPNRNPNVNQYVEQARAVFSGPVALAQDLMTISFD